MDRDAQPRLSRAETKENTHRALKQAADRILSRLGYQSTTLDAIAAEAGFTKGAVYWHFRNKEALFLELLADGFRKNSRELDELLSSLEKNPDSLDDQLGRWIDEIDTRDNLPLLALEMELESRRNPSFAALLEPIVTRHQGVIGRILSRYFELAGRTPPMSTDELAGSIIAFAKGVALARQTHSSVTSSAKLIRALLGIPAKS